MRIGPHHPIGLALIFLKGKLRYIFTCRDRLHQLNIMIQNNNINYFINGTNQIAPRTKAVRTQLTI